MRRLGVSVWLLVVTVLVVMLGAAATAAKRPPSTGPTVFELSGSVESLYPTVDRTLHLKIENPYTFAITVDEIDITVTDATPSCPGSALAVGPAGAVSIAAGGETLVPVVVTLSASAPDACQGASFPLSYHASATRSR